MIAATRSCLRRHCSNKHPGPLVLGLSLASSMVITEPLMEGCLVDVLAGAGEVPHSHLFSTFWPVLGLCKSVSAEKRYLMKVENYIYLWL